MFLLSRAVADIRSCTTRLGSLRIDSTSLRTLRYLAPKARRRWSEEEKAIVANLFRAKWSHAGIGEHIGRSLHAVDDCLRGLRQRGMLPSPKGAKNPPYTPEDDSRLLAAREEELSWHRISKLFVNRTPHALRSRHKRILSIRLKSSTSRKHPETADTAETCGQSYTEEDDNRMLHLRIHEKLTFEQIAYVMRRSRGSLRNRWYSLPPSHRRSENPPYIPTVADEYQELKKSGRLPDGPRGSQRHWTPRDISVLRAMVAAGSRAEEVAVALSTSITSVRAHKRLHARDLKFHGTCSLWTEAQKSKLLSMKARGHSFYKIAEELSLSKAAVMSKYYRLLKQDPCATQTEKAEATGGEPADLKQEQSSEQRLQLRHWHADS